MITRAMNMITYQFMIEERSLQEEEDYKLKHGEAATFDRDARLKLKDPGFTKKMKNIEIMFD